MTARLIRIGAVCAAIGLAAPLAAQSVDDDVRCLLAGNAFARIEKDPSKNQVAKAAAAYYLGRLDARISTDQLKAALAALAKTMNQGNAGPIMNGCVRRLLQKSAALESGQPTAAKPH